MWLTKEFRGTVSQGRLVSCSPNHSRPTFFFVVVVVVRPREIPFIHGQIVSRQLNSASVAQTYRVKSVVWGVLKNQVVPTCSAHCIESSGLFHRREKKKRGGGQFSNRSTVNSKSESHYEKKIATYRNQRVENLTPHKVWTQQAFNQIICLLASGII